MKIWSMVLALSLGALVACSVLAAEAKDAKKDTPKKPRPTLEEVFARLDVNRDGKLSQEEFLGKKTGDAKVKAEQVFAEKDRNKDGSLTLEELKAGPKKDRKKDANKTDPKDTQKKDVAAKPGCATDACTKDTCKTDACKTNEKKPEAKK